MPGADAEGQGPATPGQTPAQGIGDRPLGGYSATAKGAFAMAQAAQPQE